MAETKIIILDFDGTLGDTASVIIKTMHETIREMGLPTRTDAECVAMIGLRLVEIPPVLFPECNIDVDLYADTYRRLFDIHNKDGAVKLYPHVIETLKALKARGLTLTIASSRGQTSLSQFVKNLGLTEIITYILGAGDVENGKPHPEAIFKTLDKYGFTPDQAIMVGDTIFDIQMGINAGTRTCGVTYGNGSRESLSPADWLIDEFSELLALACPITEEKPWPAATKGGGSCISTSNCLTLQSHHLLENMVGKYKVITLCGSTKFKEQYLEAQKRLTLEGNIVISVGLFGHSGDDEVWTEGTKAMLDDMHKRKIDMADEIFVINVGGYIGESTRGEIAYAESKGIVVKYLE